MAITLRADKGSALTHDQVDTNFTSFIYSASLSGGTLTFFTTGSTGLGLTSTSSSFMPSKLWNVLSESRQWSNFKHEHPNSIAFSSLCSYTSKES